METQSLAERRWSSLSTGAYMAIPGKQREPGEIYSIHQKESLDGRSLEERIECEAKAALAPPTRKANAKAFLKKSFRFMWQVPNHTLTNFFKKTLLPSIDLANKVAKAATHTATATPSLMALSSTSAILAQAFALPAIVTSINNFISKLRQGAKLHYQIKKIEKSLPKAKEFSEKFRLEKELERLKDERAQILKELAWGKKTWSDLLIASGAAIVAAAALITSLKSLSAGLASAAQSVTPIITIVGPTFAAISLAFNAVFTVKAFYEVAMGIKEFKAINRQLQKLPEVSASLSPDLEVFYELETQRLQFKKQMVKIELRKNLISTLPLIAGTIGSALALAAAFTYGTTAIVLIGVTLGVTLVGAAIYLFNEIKSKQYKKQLEIFRKEESGPVEEKLKKLAAWAGAADDCELSAMMQAMGIALEEKENFRQFPHLYFKHHFNLFFLNETKEDPYEPL